MREIKYKLLDLGNLDFPDLHKAYDYWCQLKGKGENVAPSWADFCLLDLPPKTLPKLCIVDVAAEASDFTYRYWGSAVTDLQHYDLSGKSVNELTPPEFAKCIREQYLMVCESRQPHVFITEVPMGEGYFTFYIAVRLPLSSDGQTIDKILTAEEFGDDRVLLKQIFESTK